MRPAQSNSSRILVFDLLRIILLFLVLHIHFEILAQAPIDWVSTYEYLAVPLFVILSFYLTAKHFLKEEMSKKELVTRLSRLAIPLCVWSLVGFLPHLSTLTPTSIFLQLLTGEFVNLSLYYLNLMIIITILCFGLTYVKRKFRIGLYVAITLVAFSFQYSGVNYSFFHPQVEVWQYSYSRLMELLPYAMVGLFFGIAKLRFGKDTRYAVGVLIASFVGFHLVKDLPTPKGFNYQGLIYFFESIIVFAAVLLVSHIQLDNHVSRIVRRAGEYTFGVYLLHYPVLELLLKLSPVFKATIDVYPILSNVVFMIFGMLVCLTLDLLTKKKVSFLFR